ncbi:phage protein Gp37, partial [Escherichia coli]
MITETEQAYIARIREYFGNELVSVDTHPGDWSDSVLRTMLINAPAIYVAWLGAGEGRTRGRLVSHWVFYVIGDMLN